MVIKYWCRSCARCINFNVEEEPDLYTYWLKFLSGFARIIDGFICVITLGKIELDLDGYLFYIKIKYKRDHKI